MSTQFPLISLSWHLLVVMLLAIAVKVLCRCEWFRNRPSLMHSLWILVMLKLITPAIVALPIYDCKATSNWFHTAGPQETPPTASTKHLRSGWSKREAEPPKQSVPRQSLGTSSVFGGVQREESKSLPDFTSTKESIATSTSLFFLQLDNLVYIIWTCVSIVFLIRLSMRIIRVHRLRRCLATDSTLQSTAEEIGL